MPYPAIDPPRSTPKAAPGKGGPRPYVTETRVVAAREPVMVADTGVLFTRQLTWQHDYTRATGMVISNNATARWNRGSMVRMEEPVPNLPPSHPPFDPTNPNTYFTKRSAYSGWDYRPDQSGIA